jgi:signal transduction histidine kinase
VTDPSPQTRRPTELDREIESELVQHLVRQAPTGFATGILTIAAVMLVLWQAAPRRALLTWLVAMALLTAPAFVFAWRFRRLPQVPVEIAPWRRALAVCYGLAGLGWSSASILLYPHVSTSFQLFLLFVLGGSGVGGMVALAPVRGAFIAYLSATYLPMIAVLILGATLSSVATGLLLLVFWVAAMMLASEFRTLLVRSVSLRFENLELIADLSRAKDEAEKASRTKTAFLANVSHELRTPLMLILGPLRRILGSGVCVDEQRADLETVERNAHALQRHVNDLLEVARLDAGRMELDPSQMDLVEAVRRTASLFEVVARERGVELSVETPDALLLSADSGKIERVLLNLLSNAMKFVPGGGRVRVALRALPGEAVLSVEDSGPGVPVALREAIFERFRTGGEGVMRSGGTGLGLAIARELISLHGGRIEVGEGADGGARFEVRLPYARQTTTGAATAARPSELAMLDEDAQQMVKELRPRSESIPELREGGSRGLVLIVEDNPEMSRFLGDCLALDYRVATAFDGRQGLERALELRPDLILCDVMLPVMGGDALVRALRTHPELEGIPIVVLTAKADDALRVRLLREGAQDFLTKPFAAEELRARVANFVMLKRARDVLQRALSSQSRDLAALADGVAAANRAKDEFLAVLSHELKTPLTPILSWALLLQQGRLDAPTSVRGLEAIERNARLQARIIEDLLDVSRAMTGKLTLNLAPIALGPVILAAIDAVRSTAEAKRIALEVEIDPEAGLVSGDADRLQQVVWNLLSNAIKFTPQGGRVEIRLARVDAQLQLRVRDNGRGIRRELLPRLFERFWQADSSTTRLYGGLGLGLAVVRHLVELHGGSVGADSDGEGQGATFTATLPLFSALRQPVAAERAAEIPPTFQGLRVLVVDDNPDTCEIVAAILERAGAEVRTCVCASQALTTMDRWLPDLLVSDIAMPGEDGYTLIRKVRARRTEEGGRVPAVALTAYGRSEDRAKALSAGFQVHVEKPIEPSDLVGTVASITGRGAETLH